MYIYIIIFNRNFIHSITDKNIVDYDDLQIDNELISQKTGKLIVGKILPNKRENQIKILKKVINLLQQLLVF